MVSPLNNALIIGGGFSGTCAAIELRKRGIEVDLVEITPDWQPLGAGLTTGGPTLRALKTIGVFDGFLKHGATYNGIDLKTADGQSIATLALKKPVSDDDIPASGAIMRPVLAKMLSDATVAAGVKVRLDCTFTHLSQDADGVDVAFTDGSQGRYDLLIGADGVFSNVRDVIFPDAVKPDYTGQGVWRAVLPRPASVQNAMLWHAPELKIGVNPVSKDQMYLYILESRAEKEFIEPERWPEIMRGLLDPFTDEMVQMFRAQIDENSQTNFRPLEGLLLPQPWYSGRIVLIGDTVHATTPHLAMGAGIGIEDAVVLAEEMARAKSVPQGLDSFEARRWERCRMVVENSARLGEIEMENGDKIEHTRIMRNSTSALALPI